MIDFDRFVEPIAGDNACGPDCEYDNDFLALSQATAGKPEQQFGDTVIPAVDPDWREVDSLATAMLERTRDLRRRLAQSRQYAFARRKRLCCRAPPDACALRALLGRCSSACR